VQPTRRIVGEFVNLFKVSRLSGSGEYAAIVQAVAGLIQVTFKFDL
jgi:hypothetical protein